MSALTTYRLISKYTVEVAVTRGSVTEKTYRSITSLSKEQRDEAYRNSIRKAGV